MSSADDAADTRVLSDPTPRQPTEQADAHSHSDSTMPEALADTNSDTSAGNFSTDAEIETAAPPAPTTPTHSPNPSPAASPSPLTQSPLTQAAARTSYFFTPTKSTTLNVASSPAPSSLTNGHSTITQTPSAALPSAATTTPLTSREKPPLGNNKATLHTPSTAHSSHVVRGKGSSLEFDPLLRPVQQKGAVQDDDSSGGSATPSHSPAGTLAPLRTSASSSDLSVHTSASPATSPSHVAHVAATPSSSASSSLPAVAATPTSSAASSSSSAVTFSSSTPLASSSSTSGLSSWFSSFSSSSFSRDVALISTPPALFDNYYNEITALLHVLQQHPVPNVPASVTAVQEKLSTTAPSSSALSAALSDHDNRRKQAATYNTSNAKKKLVKLQKMLQANDSFVMDMKHLILKARRKCDAGHDALVAIVERLRVCFWMNEFNLLQEGMHLQDELFDNYEDMCKACIRQVKEKTKELQQLAEQLTTASSAATSLPPLNEFFFLSPRQLAMLCPALPEMLQRQSDLATRLGQVKVEYVAVAKVTEEEEKVSRNDRIVRVVDDFFSNYNGDLTADYSPARTLEYEFTRCCLDERCKEGQLLNKWMTTIQQQARAQMKDNNKGGKDKDKERVTHSSILHFVRKFESNFVRDYSIAATRRLFLRLLIQRMLFPRIWDVCVVVEDSESDTREQDEKFVAQAEWLRCLGLEQLGVPAAFLMPEQVKVAVSSRWSKGRQGQQAEGVDEDEGVGGGKMPRELPTVLKGLLHMDEKKSEESVSRAGQGESGSVAALVDDGDEDDEFGRLFTKGSGGRKKKTVNAGDNLFAKFDEDSKAAADNSPSLSPSPSVVSPLSTSMSSTSLSTSVPLSSTPPVASTSPPAISSVPALPASASATNITSTPVRASSHAASAASSASSSSSPPLPLAPLTTRINALKARHPPLHNRLRPYLSCIDCLEDITHLTCPLDMLQCLLAVARNIYKTATEYSLLNSPPQPAGAKKAELGADSFFPILLYVLIQSDVKDMHRRLRFMKEYGLVKTDDLAEHKYYCTCVEGGVNYVMNAQPEEY